MDATVKALDIMHSEGCELIIHTDDICSPFTARIIKESGISHRAVFGNNDGDKIALAKRLDIGPGPWHIHMAGISIMIFHEPFINDYIDPTQVDLVVYEHTHQKDMYFRKGMLVINPGAICGVLSEGKTL